jgi:hypothetical protein
VRHTTRSIGPQWPRRLGSLYGQVNVPVEVSESRKRSSVLLYP